MIETAPATKVALWKLAFFTMVVTNQFQNALNNPRYTLLAIWYAWLQLYTPNQCDARNSHRMAVWIRPESLLLFRFVFCCNNGRAKTKKKSRWQRASVLSCASSEWELNRIHVDGNQSEVGTRLSSPCQPLFLLTVRHKWANLTNGAPTVKWTQLSVRQKELKTSFWSEQDSNL